MQHRKDELLEKYWKGESSLEEERELRALMTASDVHSPERELFFGLEELSKMENPDFVHPKNKGSLIQSWNRWAAVLLAFLALSWLTVDYFQKIAEKQAYEQVMEAFSLIQENMEKGTQNLYLMDEFRHLNKPNEIFPLIESNHE
ncbi:hypothetical protein [Pleomorphovibrio marinus]|uniref:hypothetical protein n=1 Tax=Pleomorphovibrio marinus TaxID=2164132 RepID=UPI000E0B9A45|nr:hypothetical protein [Pleomorphovibrio marinus]